MKYWIYLGEPLTQAPEDSQGFVYIIENTKTNRKYIGQKNFWTTKKLPPLKGKQNRRHRQVETDWQDYWGSSTELSKDIQLLGTQHFYKKILKLCANKTEMNYLEAKLQFDCDVLLSDEYYNGIINCRINSRGLNTDK